MARMTISTLSALALVVAAAAVANAAAADRTSQQQLQQVTPLAKVVQMLGELLGKAKAEKHNEEVAFSATHEWCDHEKATLSKSIEDASAQILQLSADIEKAESDAKALGDEIAEHNGASAKASADLDSAKAHRGKEHADYLAQHEDFSESIDAIERAISTLKAREPDLKQVKESLLQVRDSPRPLPSKAEAVLESLMAMHSAAGSEELAAPLANAYEFQSTSVVDMLEKLRLKFQDEREALEKAEMNAKHNHEKLAQDMEDLIRDNDRRAGEKTTMKNSKLETAATAKGDKFQTEASKAADEKSHTDTTASCIAQSEEFEKNQVTRAEEIKAIEKALEILQSSSVKGHADTYLPKFVQGAVSLAQVRSLRAAGDHGARRRVVEYLQGRAHQLGSKYLSLVANHAKADPFGKVTKMIEELIFKLEAEQNSEADLHAWCSTELATNKQTRENKAAEVESLTAESEKLAAESARLIEEITSLSDAVAEIRGQQSEATKIRGEEKATNAQTVADAKEAQAAVEAATKVLRDYYMKAADASLIQGTAALGQEMTRATDAAPYKGMQDESKGVFGMLEVILSDFARLAVETTDAEDAAQAAHEKYMAESTEDIAVKETEIKHKTAKKEQTDEYLASTKKELALTQEELDAALTYHDKLKEDCVDQGLSYEDRVRAREEEIKSLKEALHILNQSELTD